MIELNDLAFQNADILIALDEGPNGQWDKRSLAHHVGRDESNLGKTLKRLVAAGLLDKNPLAGLTEAGEAQLAAIQRARGEVDATALARWPAHKIVRNPDNRDPTPDAVATRADTIEAARDILTPVLLGPPDANGVRMLLAGEHRWRAVLLLAAEGRLPLALRDGLPFQERKASAAEQILIRLLENSGVHLSPLDDARQLLALQEATGWSAREIAKKTGRSPADSDAGVRDVQVKIKIAREAAPEAIAAYERDGGWDALRDSVTRPKPPSEPPAQGEGGVLPGGESALAEIDVRRTPFAAVDGGVDPVITLRAYRDGGGNIGWGWSVRLASGVEHEGRPREFLPNPELAKSRAIDTLRDLHRAELPIAAVRWLDAQLGENYVDGVNCFNATIAGERRRALGWEKRASNGGGQGLKAALQTLAEEAKAPPPPADAAPRALGPEDPDADGVDAWGRDHNGVVADRACLTRIEDFFAGRSGGTDPAWPRRLMAEAVGLEGPFEVDDAMNVLATPAAALQPLAVLTADVGAAWPPERARALALLVAWALNKTFGESAR